MKKKQILALISIFFITGCSNDNHAEIDSEINTYHQAINQTLEEIKEELKEEYGLVLSAIGEAGTADKLKKLNLGFCSKKCLNEEEARRWIVKSADIILKNINSSESLNSFLDDVPFTIKNLTLALFFKDKKNALYREPCVGIVSVGMRGVVEYHYKAEGQKFGYSRIDEESFEEAVAKLNMN